MASGLMLTATVLTVIFATRGAMAGSGHIIDVLHFVGAEARFIAAEFRRHFLLTGMKGAAAGGLAAIVVFAAFWLLPMARLAVVGASGASRVWRKWPDRQVAGLVARDLTDLRARCRELARKQLKC